MPTFVHFETLRQRVASHPNTPVFKLPKPGALGQEWVDISYTQFQADIDRLAKLWLATLSAQNIPSRSVIGIWLRGFTYEDFITILSVSRAGFVPQMFGFALPNTRMFLELLSKYDGKAIIHDPAKTSPLLDSKTTLPCHVAVDYDAISDADVAQLPLPELPEAEPEDFTFISLSSGSTSGMPKVVPRTNKWLSTVKSKHDPASRLRDPKDQDVYLWTGSLSHTVGLCLLLVVFHSAGCLVQGSSRDFDSHELASMIRKAGVNRILQFTSILRGHLEDARAGTVEPDLLALLKGVREISYAGMALETELEDWAMGEGIPIMKGFGCTECGRLLTSMPGDRSLQMVPAVSYKFVPVGPTSLLGTAYERLLELWVLPDSPDLPVNALCTPEGGWRSGDLFEEVGEGRYLFRGRDDDWIKSRWSTRVETKEIEDNVYTTCSDLVANCVVVGSGRPFPALFIEPRSAAIAESAELSLNLRQEIIKRTSDFHSIRYLHERIVDPRMIRVVMPKTLPRTVTKGNIRRRAVEQEFADDLEAMYASMPTTEVFANVWTKDVAIVGRSAPRLS